MEPVPTATPSPAAPRAKDKSIWKFWLRETPILAEILKGLGFTMVRITFCLTSGFFSLTSTSTSVTVSSCFSVLLPLSKNKAFSTGTARKNTALTTKESTKATGNRKYFAKKSSIFYWVYILAVLCHARAGGHLLKIPGQAGNDTELPYSSLFAEMETLRTLARLHSSKMSTTTPLGASRSLTIITGRSGDSAIIWRSTVFSVVRFT